MSYLCTTRFDLNNAEAKQLEKFFTLEEIEAAREQNRENLKEIKINMISDDEEEVEEVSGRKHKSRADDDFEQY
ncbi:hypothetical protein BDV11DRAFT_176310 [Aspergillus similis]